MSIDRNVFFVKHGWLLTSTFVLIVGWAVIVHLLKIEGRVQDDINKAIVETAMDLEFLKVESQKEQ